MTDGDQRPILKRLESFILGDRERIAGTVYGTIVVMAVLAAGPKPYEHALWRLDVIAGVSVIVLWLAHVYSDGLGESLKIGRRVRLSELSSIARREYSVVAAAILPLIGIGLGAVGILAPSTAIRLGLWFGVLALTVQGVRYARLEQMSTSAALLTVGMNLGIGLGLVALEVLVAH